MAKKIIILSIIIVVLVVVYKKHWQRIQNEPYGGIVGVFPLRQTYDELKSKGYNDEEITQIVGTKGYLNNTIIY